MLIVSSVKATELSFLLFFVSAGLVFDQVVAGFHFHSHEKRLISLLITTQTWLKRYLKTESVLKLNRCYPIQALIGSVSWQVFVGRVCLQSEGFFNCLFLVLYFLLRGDTLRSNNSERINFFFFGGGGGGVDFPKNKSNWWKINIAVDFRFRKLNLMFTLKELILKESQFKKLWFDIGF